MSSKLRMCLTVAGALACFSAQAQQAESPLGGGPIVFGGSRVASLAGAPGATDTDDGSVDATVTQDAVAVFGVRRSRLGLRSGRGGGGNGDHAGEAGGRNRGGAAHGGGGGQTGMGGGKGSGGAVGAGGHTGTGGPAGAGGHAGLGGRGEGGARGAGHGGGEGGRGNAGHGR